ncbi:MAG TPA: hypothetical protein V6D14_01680 [Coleofasciculaceae cyanobacterium]
MLREKKRSLLLQVECVSDIGVNLTLIGRLKPQLHRQNPPTRVQKS